MTRSRRRRRRISIAVLCCVPTLLVLAAWVVGANTSLLAPGRALPQRIAAGISGHQYQLYSASNAIEFDDLPAALRGPAAAGPQGLPGRQFLETKAGVIDRGEGIEWHGTFATHFSFVGVPMWLPLLLTSPLLLITARQVYLLRKSLHRGRAGVCAHCGHEMTADDRRCPGCGSPPASSDPVSSVLLSGGPSGIAPSHRETP